MSLNLAQVICETSQVVLVGGRVFFLGGSPVFAHLSSDPSRNEWNTPPPPTPSMKASMPYANNKDADQPASLHMAQDRFSHDVAYFIPGSPDSLWNSQVSVPGRQYNCLNIWSLHRTGAAFQVATAGVFPGDGGCVDTGVGQWPQEDSYNEGHV